MREHDDKMKQNSAYYDRKLQKNAECTAALYATALAVFGAAFMICLLMSIYG